MHINKNNLDSSNEQLIEQLLNVERIVDPNTTLTISVVGAGGKTHLIYWLANFFKQREHRVCITTSTKMYLPDKACIEAHGIDHLVELSKGDRALVRGKLTESSNTAPSITFLYQEKCSQKNISEQVKVEGLSLEALQSLHHRALFSVLIVEADGAKHHPIKAPANHEPNICQHSKIVIGVTGAEAIFLPAKRDNIHRWAQFSAVTHCLPEMEIGYPVLKRLLVSSQGMFKNAPDHALKIWVINKYDLCVDADALLPLANRLLNELPRLKSIWLTQFKAPTAIKSVLVN